MKRRIFFLSGFLCLVASGVATQMDSVLNQVQILMLSMTLGLACAGVQVIMAYQYYRLNYFDWAYLGYFTFGFLLALFAPAAAGYIFIQYAALSIFILLSSVAIVPSIIGLPMFTYDFSKPSVPEEMWDSPDFKTINRHLTLLWAVIFVTGAGFALVGYLNIFLNVPTWYFTGVIPVILSFGIGFSITKRYPLYYLKRKSCANMQTDLPEDISDFLQAMSGRYNTEAGNGLQAVIQFDIIDQPDANVYFNIEGAQCKSVTGNAKQPTLVIHTPAQVWVDISSDRMSGGAAFMEKKYTVEGDIRLLLKMQQLFQGASNITK